MNPAQLLAHFDRVAEAPEAVPRLRRFILDLAVRGKLVDQYPEDEPASALLKRIASKKAHLVEAGEIRREKPLSFIEEEELTFDVPSSWSWARLRNLTSYMQRGKSPSYTSAEGRPVISQRCVQWDGLHLEWAKLITPESLDSYEPIRFLRDGDLLWNSTGTGTIGRVTRVENPAERLVCDSHVTVVRCLLVDERFICIWLRSDYVYGTIEDRAAGATNQVELTAAVACNQVTPLPPLAEQHRIVAKVDELMALCDELEAAQAKREMRRDRLAAATLHGLNNGEASAEPGVRPTFEESARFTFHHLPRLTTRPEHIQQLRETILNLAVRGKLVEQNPEDEPVNVLLENVTREKELRIKAGEFKSQHWRAPDIDASVLPSLPGSWRWIRVQDLVCMVTVGHVGSMATRYQDSGIPFLRSQNVRPNRFEPIGLTYVDDNFHAELKKSQLSGGDVVVVRSGNVGVSCVVPESLGNANCADLVIVKRPLGVGSQFLCYYLNSVTESRIQEGKVGIALSHFNTRSVAFLPIPLPPLAEQHRIVAKVDELMALCDALEAQLTTTANTSRQLLEAALAEALGQDHDPHAA